MTTMTLGTLEDFRAMALRPRTPPTTKWDDTNAKDISTIWQTIATEAPRWRGNNPRITVHGMPTDRRLFWGAFSQNHNPELLPVVEEFADQSAAPGTALDLGCGNSPATALLLSRGWRVIAVDNAEGILPVVATRHPRELASGQLQLAKVDIADFTPPEPVDLVVAADVFPYIDPAKFRAAWTKVHNVFLRERGHLVGSLFASSPETPSSLLNMMEEMGGWFLPDRRMVRPLLADAGYTTQICKYRVDSPNAPRTCIQFIAQKA